MGFLPFELEDEAEEFGWTSAQKITYVTIDYLAIATYGFLVLLALCNIWVILIRQKEYKNLPILAFYVFTLLAVTLRTIFIIE